MRDITARITATRDLDDVLASITRGLVESCDAVLARIWLLSTDIECPVCSAHGPVPARGADEGPVTAALHLRASHGSHTNLAGHYHRIRVGALKIGQIAASRTPVFCNNVFDDDRFVDKQWIEAQAIRAFAGYPLIFRDELLGVIGIFSTGAISEHDFQDLQIFADQAATAIRNAQLFAEIAHLNGRLALENAYLQQEIREEGGFEDIVGDSPALRAVLHEIEQVARTDATVLLTGETGTGKELIARAIHRMSRRSAHTLVKVNCGAFPAGLVESELFGHEKGAFTGALQQRIGRFELADKGTLFLDEVGELPADAQVKLLRVLQEQEFERVGGARSIRVDVRVVAATNRDLADEVKTGRFRADLYYRLHVFPMRVPALRERRGDVPLLVQHLLMHLQRKLAKPLRAITAESMTRLERYTWPGNVRELQNVLERAAVLARGPIVDVPDPNTGAMVQAPEHTVFASLEDAERTHIREALQRTDGVIHGPGGAAALLKVNPTTLRSRMERLGILTPRRREFPSEGRP
ncbi:sigma-54-dependent Fis family transcriptional regulator [Gemmatimonas groenlandica]|uniref:sigma-54-dependent Fis family transcriptional regulator n=1 Tax=Gemmatimonas groenlandica TaxID=2732249 RepID=UPI001980344A|nr:sigma 54-interacting transcriptional regulator [Gemmatimonas groenlandica]